MPTTLGRASPPILLGSLRHPTHLCSRCIADGPLLQRFPLVRHMCDREPCVGLELEFAAVASSHGVKLLPRPSLPWLSVRGHLDRAVQREAPAETLDELHRIHMALGGSPSALSAKSRGSIRPDLVTPTGQIVEVDEVQHFTTARQVSFREYPQNIPVGFSIDHYLRLITIWRSKGDAAFAHKKSVDFNFPGGRQAQRAYNDALRDLLAPVFTGMSVVRVAVPDRFVTSAVARYIADRTSDD